MADEPKAPATGEPAVVAPALDEKAYLQFFPEDIRGEKTLEKFSGKDLNEVLGKVAKSYVNLEKMPRGVQVPTEASTPEERAAFLKALGVPDTPEEYGVEAKVPEGMPWNKDVEKVFLGKMHKRGLTKPQAQGVIDDYLELAHQGTVEQKQAQAKSSEDAYVAMKQEWGGLIDRNTALVQRTVHEFGDADFKAYLDDTGLGNDPRFLRFAYKLGSVMLEDNLISGENLGMTRDAAKTELATLMRTPEYMKGDKVTMQKVRDLYPLVYGDD